MVEDVSLIESPPDAKQPPHDANTKSTIKEMSVLGAHGLKKSYRKRAVVNNVSLEIHQGEIVGLLGPNGAGKTTAFYMTVGLIKPNEGHIYLDKEDITKLPMY